MVSNNSYRISKTDNDHIIANASSPSEMYEKVNDMTLKHDYQVYHKE